MIPNQPDIDSVSRRLTDTLGDAWASVVSPARDTALDADISAKAASAAPVVWLLGKVQSGKSSIVRALTGASEAEIGNGFRACTSTARIFEFPATAPVIRFLDTRGLAEAGYDPTADIAVAEQQAHLLLVVMKAGDVAQDAVLGVVRTVRAKHPDWPVLVAQTCLHEGYDLGENHLQPYPFNAQGISVKPLPPDLERTLAWQRERGASLPGHGAVKFVPLDFTSEEDGYVPRFYGLDAIRSALVEIAPDAIVHALAADAGAASARAQRVHQHILGYAAAAAAADIVPVAGAIAVPAVQAKMLHSLGEIHGVVWDRTMMGELASGLGAGVLARLLSSFGARQLAKLIPVYGQTAGAAAAAAMSFAATFALGKAATIYLEHRSNGRTGMSGVREAYEEGLRSAMGMARNGATKATADPKV